MHHLILVRQSDPGFSGSIGCCCRIAPGDVRWDLTGHKFPERWEKKTGFGGLFRTLKERFAGEVEVTVLDPRNLFAFIPLVVRDAIRFGVPIRAMVRAVTSTSNSTAVLDGRVVYQGSTPSTEEVVEMVESRLA